MKRSTKLRRRAERRLRRKNRGPSKPTEAFLRASWAAERLIKRLTPAEKHLKKFLKASSLSFVCQKPIAHTARKVGSVLDFYFPGMKLAIELDGPYHSMPEQKEKDRLRDYGLGLRKIKVLRYTNEVALSDPQRILRDVEEFRARKLAHKAARRARRQRRKARKRGEIIPAGVSNTRVRRGSIILIKNPQKVSSSNTALPSSSRP